MPTIQDAERLKREVETAKSSLANSQGAIAQLKKQAKISGGTNAIREKLIELEAKRVESERKLNNLIIKLRKSQQLASGLEPGEDEEGAGSDED